MSEDLKRLDSQLPTYPLWMRLSAFLGSLCEALTELQIAVRGDGNGTRGLLDRMTVVEGAVKVSQSDIREILNIQRNVHQIGKDGQVKKFNAENHPSRRSTDKQLSTFDKVLKYFVDKVLPQLIVWAILAFIAFQVALNQHIIVSGG